MLNRAWILRFSLALGCLVPLSCADAPADEPPLSVSVRWGLSGASALPADVTEIEIVRCPPEDGEDCPTATCTITGLTEGAPGCRPTEGTEMFADGTPVLIRDDLPVRVPISFRLRAKVADGSYAYVGVAGPFVLGEGERRQVDLFMYRIGQTVPLPVEGVARFLHTASYLPDGRILVAGGFDSATRMTACPDALMLREETRCFELEATDEALAFDVTNARVEPIRNGMLAARAGHTATTLPDGRVLLAGGAPRAILAMIPQGDPPDGTYASAIFPQLADGSDGAHASFELFDAFLDPEAEDLDRDGDIGRGRFLGTAATSSPGALNHPRFLHAAAARATEPGQVLLAGGMGGDDSAASYEVFDANKPGGYGVYQGPGNRLTTPRPVPSAVGIGEQVWIFGGVTATSNEELADVWTEGTEGDPNGSTFPATMSGAFPNDALGETDPQPQYSLFRPSVAAVDDGQRALVVGWYGPQCEVGSNTPIFPTGAETTQLCNSPTVPTTRSFTTLAADTGVTVGTPARLHAFGAMAETYDFERTPGSRLIAVTGGIANASWGANAAIDVFTGEVDSTTGVAQTLDGASVSLRSQRIFHTTTGVPAHGLVTVGGISFSLGLESVLFEDGVEVVFLDRP